MSAPRKDILRVPTVAELLEEALNGIGTRYTQNVRYRYAVESLAQRLHVALAEVERLRAVQEVGIAMVTLDLRLRAEAAEAEVARLRTFFAYSEESIWKQRAEAAEAEVAELRADRERLESVALSADRLVARTIELRARIEAAVQFTITKRLRRTDGLLRILRGEEKP